MPAVINGTGRIHFGIFEVDLRSGELRRNGSKVRLQEQPFQILTVLLERPGDVVTREELRSRLWPADTYVDFDHSLNTAVRRLRDALGDSAENPRFIETVARRGYRFLVPLNGNATSTAAQPLHSNKKLWAAAILSALCVLIAGLGIGFRVGRLAPRTHILLRRLTANPEEDGVTNATLSPDGRYLAFSDRTGFYLEQVDTGETHAVPLPRIPSLQPASWFPDTTHGARPIPQPSQPLYPEPAGWFPDSTHLLATWVASPDEPPALWKISVLGGEPRMLAHEAWRSSVSPDGSLIAFERGGSEKETCEIWVMRSNGEQPRLLRTADDSYCGKPAWDPDSRRLAYAHSSFVPGTWQSQTEIDVLDVATRENRLLYSVANLGAALAWTPQGRVIYSVDEPPPNQTDSNLWSIQIDPGSLRAVGSPNRITAQSGGVADVSLSADGKRLALTRRTIEPDVYVASVRDQATRVGPLKRLTLDERADVPYSWTPDSRSVIFISDRYGVFNIFKQDVDQPTPELLVGGKDPLSIARLSPDGREIIYVAQPHVGDASVTSLLAGGKDPLSIARLSLDGREILHIAPPHVADASVTRLMRVPLTGGPSQQILAAQGIMNQQCARLPSTVCVYSQMLLRSEMHLYTFDLAHGKGREIEKARVINQDAYSYNWSLSPDGQTLAMARKTGLSREPGIRLLSISGDAERTITLRGWPGIACLDWASDGKSIWAVAYTSTRTKTLLNVDLQGRVRPVLEENKMVLGWAIPSPDGRQLAIWKASGGSNVWLIENF